MNELTDSGADYNCYFTTYEFEILHELFQLIASLRLPH